MLRPSTYTKVAVQYAFILLDCTTGSSRVGQNPMDTPYIPVYLMKSLQKLLCIHRIHIWFWPTLEISYLALTLTTRAYVKASA